MACNTKFYNVIMHGVCFMLIFTAFQTSGNVQTSVLNSIHRDGEQTFKNKGYISLAIIYTVFALSNFIAPPIVNLFGPRAAMFVGGICYSLFIGSLIYPFVSTLYIASVIVGVGAALIWTGQGNFLTINSDKENMGRNSGIFWALLQCSLLFGNMFVYFFFKGDINISDHGRETLYTVLLSCACIGTLAITLLRKTPTTLTLTTVDDEEPIDDESLKSLNRSQNSSDVVHGQSPLEAFKKSFKLLISPDMLLLSVTIAYTGFELTFFSGVYGTSIGNIIPIVDRKRMIGLIGMLIGAGEITGGLLFGIFGHYTNKYGRDPIVLVGFLIHMATFYLIFLNVPNEAPLNETSGDSWLNYNVYLYGFCAYTLGFGDASFNTQLYSALGTLYSDDSAPAFALFKFVQSVAAAIGFAYGTVLALNYQLAILVVFGFMGTITFFIVERKHAKHRNEGYEQIK